MFGQRASVDQSFDGAAGKSKAADGDKEDDNSEEERNDRSSYSNMFVTPSSTPDIADEYSQQQERKRRKNIANTRPEPKVILYSQF